MEVDFDAQYKGFTGEGYYFGSGPDEIVKKVLELKEDGSVLDLGVGDGRNVLFLAEAGFKVTGVDVSAEALKSFTKKISNKLINKITLIKSDITKFEFKDKYDIILSNVTLNFLNKVEIQRLINNIKEHTKIGGINIITAYTVNNHIKDKFNYLFKKGELLTFYDKEWTIIEHKEEYKTEKEKHGTGPEHFHYMTELMVMKRSLPKSS
jgi:tellurite methyltransferase